MCWYFVFFQHKIGFRNTYFRKTLSRHAASTVFKLQTVRILTLTRVKFHATFYEEMAQVSASSKVYYIALLPVDITVESENREIHEVKQI